MHTRIRHLLLTLTLLLGAGLAHADALDDAKAAGSVGEQADGYLGVVNPPASAEIRALVASINDRRRAQYESIAARNGIALADVERLAGERAINRSAPGAWVKPPGGSWRPR